MGRGESCFINCLQQSNNVPDIWKCPKEQLYHNVVRNTTSIYIYYYLNKKVNQHKKVK